MTLANGFLGGFVNHARVELKGSEWLSHYVFVIYCLVATASAVLCAFLSSRQGDRWTFLSIAFLALLFAGVALWWQRGALGFRTIRTSRTAEHNYNSVLRLANEEEWQLTGREPPTYIQGCVAAEFGGYARRATVVFDGQDVYANSMMNPGRFFAPGLFSWGGIERDISGICDAVGGAEERS